MFTIPSLRARKPGKVEKKALDIAFLVTPLVSIGLPFATQVRCAALYVVCCMLYVVRCMCCMLYVLCCMLYVGALDGSDRCAALYVAVCYVCMHWMDE
jgi:hypothetical protein